MRLNGATDGPKNRVVLGSTRTCVIGVLAALTLVGCAGSTAPASHITRTTVTLNGQGSCSRGPCTWYFRYGSNGYQRQTPPTTLGATNGSVPVSEPVTGLVPGTRYEYQLCGSGDGLSTVVCVGPDGGTDTSATFNTPDSKSNCVYTNNSVDTLKSWSAQTGYSYACALAFDNARPDWDSWENPWFLSGPGTSPDHDWQGWKNTPGIRRQLIITISFFPQSEANTDWLTACSSGQYDQHAQALATNLVNAGLGDSVIRLAHEANDSASADGVPSTPAGQAQWAQCWHHEAAAMKSVPGAGFLMDWCVNAYWQPIPLASWYPGDDVVDIIGLDAYDAGLPASMSTEPQAWQRLYTQFDGIQAIQQFAASRGKPMSFPEWSLENPGDPTYGVGDDPVYIDNMAAVVRSTPFAYQSYFLGSPPGIIQAPGSPSYLRYLAHFGGGGDLTGDPTITP